MKKFGDAVMYIRTHGMTEDKKPIIHILNALVVSSREVDDEEHLELAYLDPITGLTTFRNHLGALSHVHSVKPMSHDSQSSGWADRPDVEAIVRRAEAAEEDMKALEESLARAEATILEMQKPPEPPPAQPEE